MNKLTFKQRVNEAVEAYLERSGMVLLQVEYHTPHGTIPILAEDHGTLVRVSIEAYRKGKKPPNTWKPPTKRTILKYTKQMEHAADLIRVPDIMIRFDVIRIVQFDNNRALLRHHRGAYTKD